MWLSRGPRQCSIQDRRHQKIQNWQGQKVGVLGVRKKRVNVEMLEFSWQVC